MLSSLRIRNYRFFAGSNLVAWTAVAMQRVAQDWLVLDLSGSVAIVGLTVGLQFIPVLLFGIPAGVFVDRHSKRVVLLVTQVISGCVSLALAVLVITGAVAVWHILIAAFLSGLATAFGDPARQVFLTELVGHDNLREAISINSVVFQLGTLLGPVASGALLVSVGAGSAFGINALGCAVAVLTLSLMRRGELFPMAAAERSKGQLREGLAYAAGHPTIRLVMTLGAVLAVFTLSFPVLLAGFASDVFDAGPAGFALFNALLAVGAIVGAVLSMRRRELGLHTAVGWAGALGAVVVMTALMPTLVAFSAALIVLGATHILFMTAANSLMQLSSLFHLRGRVLAVWIVILLGGQGIGGPLVGFMVEQNGAVMAMLVAGSAPLVCAVLMAALVVRARSLRVRIVRPGVLSIEPRG